MLGQDRMLVSVRNQERKIIARRQILHNDLPQAIAEMRAQFPNHEFVIEQQSPQNEGLEAAPGDGREASLAYQRAATIEAYCVQQMTAAAGEMNKRFLDQLDALQTRHQAAMERLDNIAFERKMMEHEATARHLSDHYRRLAEDDRRANAPSLAEQLAHHLVAILNACAIGGTPPTQK